MKEKACTNKFILIIGTNAWYRVDTNIHRWW